LPPSTRRTQDSYPSLMPRPSTLPSSWLPAACASRCVCGLSLELWDSDGFRLSFKSVSIRFPMHSHATSHSHPLTIWRVRTYRPNSQKMTRKMRPCRQIQREVKAGFHRSSLTSALTSSGHRARWNDHPCRNAIGFRLRYNNFRCGPSDGCP
jgi:hypothetical protein